MEIYKRTPEKYQDPVFWAWLGIFFIQRYISSKAAHYLLSYFCLLNTLNGTAEVHTEDLLRLSALRGIKTTFFNP